MAERSDISSPISPKFGIGEWIVRADTGRIENGSAERRLRPMLMDMLVYLAENANQVVTKERIVDRVWKGRPVGDSALSRNIAELRRFLGDDTYRPRYIETVPKRGYRLIAPVTSLSGQARPHIAVLPFANLSPDCTGDYFSDGMTDALITELGQIPGLRVISRQSVLHLRDSQKTASGIADELGVDFLIEGAVMRSDNAVRINVQLIRVFPESHIWADSYHGEIGAVLALQTRVAAAVAGEIRVKLAPTEQVIGSERPKVNASSYLAYLKARHALGSWNEQSIQQAFRYLHEAIEADSGFSLAYQAMAMCWIVLGYWGHVPIREAYPQAKSAALKARDLDPNGSDTHLAMGVVNWLVDWDLEISETALRRAVDVNPSNESAYLYLALLLITVRNDAAGCLELARIALELDPLSLNTSFGVAWLLLFSREHERAIAQAKKTIEMYSETTQPLYVMGWAYVGLSRLEHAIAAFERAATISRDPISLAYLGHVYGRAGQDDMARKILRELHGMADKRHVAPMSFAILHAGIGELDEAFAWLDRCIDERDSRLFWLQTVPAFDPIRHDTRYPVLLEKLRLGC